MGQTRATPVSGATVVSARHREPDPPPAPEPGRGRIAAGLRLSGPRLVIVFACGLIVSLAVEVGIGALGRTFLGVPSSINQLKAPGIFPYAVPPIVACTVAFVVAFIVKKPGPRSRQVFLTVGVKFALLDGLIAVLTLPGSANAGAFVTIIAVILFPLLIIPALLRFVPRPGVPLQDPARAQTIPAI